jgi:hypothetical protein
VPDILWAYKLAPETTNLPAGGGIAEIQVFRVLLKGRNWTRTCSPLSTAPSTSRSGSSCTTSATRRRRRAA